MSKEIYGELLKLHHPELNFKDVARIRTDLSNTHVWVMMKDSNVYKLPKDKPKETKMKPVSADVLKGLSQKEIEAYRIILDNKIIPLKELEEINVSYSGAVGRLKQKGLVEVLSLERDRKIKCVALTGVVPDHKYPMIG